MVEEAISIMRPNQLLHLTQAHYQSIWIRWESSPNLIRLKLQRVIPNRATPRNSG